MANSIHNLTATVSGQAVKVSEDTNSLYRAEVDSRLATAWKGNVEHLYQDAHVAAENASEALKVYQRDVETAWQRYKELNAKSEEATAALQVLLPQHYQAEETYRSLLWKVRHAEAQRNATAAAEHMLAAELVGATDREQHAKAVASDRTDDLHSAVEELNRLNAELRTLQEKLSGKSLAPQTSQWWSPLWVRVALAATVAVLAAACCFKLSKR